jgi:hypothetical protein
LGRDPGTSVDRFLYTVTAVDTLRRIVRLDRDPATETGDVGHDADLHPLLRRWDGGPVDVQEGPWIGLEDGVEVQFDARPTGGQPYRTGDYWLIPARRTTGDVIWPADEGGPSYLSPHGVVYHYAALAFVPNAANDAVKDMRIIFNPLAG